VPFQITFFAQDLTVEQPSGSAESDQRDPVREDQEFFGQDECQRHADGIAAHRKGAVLDKATGSLDAPSPSHHLRRPERLCFGIKVIQGPRQPVHEAVAVRTDKAEISLVRRPNSFIERVHVMHVEKRSSRDGSVRDFAGGIESAIIAEKLSGSRARPNESIRDPRGHVYGPSSFAPRSFLRGLQRRCLH
jgi:hypothetical protein